jgi:hypothetical protein
MTPIEFHKQISVLVGMGCDNNNRYNMAVVGICNKYETDISKIRFDGGDNSSYCSTSMTGWRDAGSGVISLDVRRRCIM